MRRLPYALDHSHCCCSQLHTLARQPFTALLSAIFIAMQLLVSGFLGFFFFFLLQLSLRAVYYVVAGKFGEITCNYLHFQCLVFHSIAVRGVAYSIVGHQHDICFWFSGLLMPTLALFVTCAILWLLLMVEITLHIGCDAANAIACRKTMLMRVV